MFDYLLAVIKIFYTALYVVVLPGLLIYITPTYSNFVHNYDTKELTEKNRRKKWENTISTFIWMSFLLFLIYCLFNYNNLKYNTVIYFLYSIIIIILFVFMMYCLILSLYAFYRMIMGKPIEINAAYNGNTIITSTCFLLILLQSLKYESIFIYLEKLINSLVNIIIKDWIIIFIYFFVFNFFAIILFSNFFNSLKIFLKYISLKSYSKRQLKPKVTNEKRTRVKIVYTIDKKANELWNVIEKETKLSKRCYLLATFTIFYIIRFLLKGICNIVLLLFIPITSVFVNFILFIKTLLSKVRESNTVTVIALSSRITIIVVFCINYVFFKYNNIISDTGVDVFEFLFSIFIIPSIFANIVKFQRK